jgi:hypothetical protein
MISLSFLLSASLPLRASAFQFIAQTHDPSSKRQRGFFVAPQNTTKRFNPQITPISAD